MGFFKEFKDDLSQAVNELLPDEEKESEKQEDTLSSEAEQDELSDDERLERWLEGYAAEESSSTADQIDDGQTDEMIQEEIMEEEIKEDEDMEENVDLELLEAMSLEEEESEVVEQTIPKVKSSSAVIDDEVTVISKGTTINGSISSDGSLDIMGNITGDVECLGKLSITGKIKGNSSASEVYVNTERLEGSVTSEGSIKIGLGTVVIGDIVATSGVIAGAVKGEIDVNGPIVVDSTAIIKGNIKAKSVQINNGAVIEGALSLSYSAVDVDNIFE
jgi:cytoskeletal protein CcmA (bactofilin family)